MKREIKFRAWSGEKMVIVNDIVFSGEKPKGFWKENSVYESSETLMQFTGLQDKNGVDIYEGDVIQYVSNGILQFREVYWDATMAGYLTRNTHFQDDILLGFGWLSTNGAIEVIGNKYQNPELLTNNKSLTK